METVREILMNNGYSGKAIQFYIDRVNVGTVENPHIHHAITGPCGDTIEIYLAVESDIIRDAKFLAIGCPGIFSSGSALTSMIIGKTPVQALSLHIEDIVEFLDGVPEKKLECVVLAKKAIDEALLSIWKDSDLY
jgi:nitrogen fixation NifU-like protein